MFQYFEYFKNFSKKNDTCTVVRVSDVANGLLFSNLHGMII